MAARMAREAQRERACLAFIIESCQRVSLWVCEADLMFIEWMDGLSMVGQDACEGLGSEASLFKLAEIN